VLIAVTLTLLTTVLLSIVSAQTHREFGELEKSEAGKDAERARDSLREYIAQMDSKLSDWSGWDDAVHYAQGNNETFEAANLLPEALQRLRLSALVIYAEDGLVRWGGMLDKSGEQFVIPSDELMAFGKPGGVLGKHESPASSTRGVMVVAGRLTLVASRPIVGSDGDGPIRGSMLWARHLDAALIDRLSVVCHNDVFLEAPAAAGTDSAAAAVTVRVCDDSTIESFAALDDINGATVARLKVKQPREIGARAGVVVTRFGWMIVTSAAVFGVLIYGLLTALVTSRIATLASDLRTVAVSRDHRRRVEAKGSDEIAALAGEVNTMLSALASAQTQVRAACAAAESASTAKSQFLANMSHEIRTPMTAILGFADLLADEGLEPVERAEHVSTIRRNGEHLLGIINDILDISKIEAGKMTVEIMRVDLFAVLEDVRVLMAGRASSKGLALGIEAGFPLPRVIQSDALRLRQILVNLVGNAIKFTESGGVTIRVAMAAEEPKRLVFSVVDTGIGMTSEQAAGLFKPFSQADASMTRRFGGTGLGLSISRALAEMLGGGLSVSAVPGLGSTFIATVKIGEAAPGCEGVLTSWPALDGPRAAATSAGPAPEKSLAGKKLAGMRVLVAEDGADNQRLIRFILSKAGSSVQIAGNGRVAVDTAMGALTAFDLILMDMQMPVLDGCSATRELRAAGYTGQIVALTANAMQSDRAECEAAGCDGFLSKPIAPERLLEECLRARGASRRGPGREAAAIGLGSEAPTRAG